MIAEIVITRNTLWYETLKNLCTRFDIPFIKLNNNSVIAWEGKLNAIVSKLGIEEMITAQSKARNGIHHKVYPKLTYYPDYFSNRCIKCDLLLRYGTGQKKVITSEEEANLFSVELDKEVDVGNVLCGKCRRSTRLVSADPNLPSTSHSHHETFPQDRDRVERQLSVLSNLSASGSSNH
uniref:Mut7-C RNAse domain-containing protein n=1 Tax=Rhodnius prolixus TaxID=13249 RepID=T1HMF9_RHOPR